MADDDRHLRGTVRFEDIDVEVEGESASPNDLLAGLGNGHDVEAVTNPFVPAYDPRATIKAEAPKDVMDRARPTRELQRARAPETRNFQAPAWVKLMLQVDASGSIFLDAGVLGLEPGDRIEVLIRKRVDDESR